MFIYIATDGAPKVQGDNAGSADATGDDAGKAAVTNFAAASAADATGKLDSSTSFNYINFERIIPTLK